MPWSKRGSSPHIAASSATTRLTRSAKLSSSAAVPAWCRAKWKVWVRPPPATVQVRTSWALSSVGLSMKYCRLGAVKVSGSRVGASCVATFHSGRSGRKVTLTARVPSPRAHMNVAGMLRWAWVRSMPA